MSEGQSYFRHKVKAVAQTKQRQVCMHPRGGHSGCCSGCCNSFFYAIVKTRRMPGIFCFQEGEEGNDEV